MSQALSDLTQSVTDLEAHAAAVNAERANLAAEVAALKAVPAPALVVTEDDAAALAVLKTRVDAVSASLVAPVVAVAEPAPEVVPAETPAAV